MGDSYFQIPVLKKPKQNIRVEAIIPGIRASSGPHCPMMKPSNNEPIGDALIIPRVKMDMTLALYSTLENSCTISRDIVVVIPILNPQ